MLYAAHLLAVMQLHWKLRFYVQKIAESRRVEKKVCEKNGHNVSAACT